MPPRPSRLSSLSPITPRPGAVAASVKHLAASWLSGFLARPQVSGDPCDVLLLHTWAGGPDRTRFLTRELDLLGLEVAHEFIPSPTTLLARRQFVPRPASHGPRYAWMERYCAYLVERYRPKVAVTMADASPLTLFLTEAMERAGGVSVNIAHSVLAPIPHYCMFASHYYLVFGSSSVEAAQNFPGRYGQARLAMTGSISIDESYSLEPDRTCDTVLFASDWLPKESRDIVLANFRILAQWASSQDRPELLIKPHPVEDTSILRGILGNTPRVRWLEQTTDPAATPRALAQASAAIVLWSNFALEAALMNRPVIVLNASTHLNSYLGLDRYFPPIARDASGLADNVESLRRDYDGHLARCRAFADYHLSFPGQGALVAADILARLVQGRDDFPWIRLPPGRDYFADHRPWWRCAP